MLPWSLRSPGDSQHHPHHVFSPPAPLPARNLDDDALSATLTYLPSWGSCCLSSPFENAGNLERPGSVAAEEDAFPMSMVNVLSPPRKLSAPNLPTARFQVNIWPRFFVLAGGGASQPYPCTSSCKVSTPRVISSSRRPLDSPGGNSGGGPRLSHWMSSFKTESAEESFSSVAVFAELRMREAIEASANSPQPSKERVAVAVDLLLKIPHLFSRYAPLVKLLSDEVVRAIYPQFRQRATGDTTPSRGDIAAAAPYFEVERQIRAEARVLKRRLEATMADGDASSIRNSTAAISRMAWAGMRASCSAAFDAWRSWASESRTRRWQLRRRADMRKAAHWFRAHQRKAPSSEDKTPCGNDSKLLEDLGALERTLETLRADNQRLLAELAESTDSSQGMQQQQSPCIRSVYP